MLSGQPYPKSAYGERRNPQAVHHQACFAAEHRLDGHAKRDAFEHKAAEEVRSVWRSIGTRTGWRTWKSTRVGRHRDSNLLTTLWHPLRHTWSSPYTGWNRFPERTSSLENPKTRSVSCNCSGTNPTSLERYTVSGVCAMLAWDHVAPCNGEPESTWYTCMGVLHDMAWTSRE